MRIWSTSVALRPHASRAAALLGVGLTVLVASRLADDLDYSDLAHAVRHTHWLQILGAVGATGLSFASLILRDAVALRFNAARVPRSAIGLAGFCGTALSNSVGFAGLSAAAVRYRIYGAVGVPAETVAHVLTSISFGFALGLTAFLSLTALIAGPCMAGLLRCPLWLVHAGAALLLLAGVGLVVASAFRCWTLRIGDLAVRTPRARHLAAQAALTLVDMTAAATALWALLPDGGVGYPTVLAVFGAAVAAGGISHVPGGLGVFEAVVLFTLRDRMPAEAVLAGLVVFRVVYFVLPLILSTAFLAAFELRRAGRRGDPAGDAPALLGSAAQLTPSFVAALTFMAGALLVGSGATPAFGSRLSKLATVFPLWQIETAHFFSSVIGLVFLFVARGLYRRLDGAWWCATLLTPVAVVLSLVKALAYNQASLLVFLFVVLVATHGQFPKRASLLRQPFTLGWWLAVTGVLAASLWLLAFAFGNSGLSDGAFWEVALQAPASRALRATVAVCVLAIVLGLGQLLRVVRVSHHLPAAADLDRAAALIEAEGRSDALLARMGDKNLLFSASGRSVLMYANRGRSWIALYDPVGPQEEWPGLVRGFLALVAEQGGRAAFYHLRPDNLSLYIDAGLQISKVGEEARIDVAGFDLAGSRRSHLRYALKRGARDGLSFDLLPPAAVDDALPALEEISDAWLAARRTREKGFSVAAFDRRYLAGQAVAVVRSAGRPVAFASVMTADGGGDATIGLMRHGAGVSAYAMEFLFTQLILALKEQGCRHLSLGTVPLSGLSHAPLSSRWIRLGHLVWRHGTMLYNFQGLRTFKGKFDPVWEPRYLAVSGSLGPYMALADAAVLCNGAILRRRLAS